MPTTTLLFENTSRLDAEEVGVFFNSLTDLELKIDREFDLSDFPFAAGSIVPLNIQNKPWAKTWKYRWLRHIGQFKLIRNYTTDLPEVEIAYGEIEMPIYKWGQGYSISEDDIAAVSRMGESIEQDKIYAVEESGNQKLNLLIANGDEETGMPGFLDHPQALRSFALYPLNGSATSQQKLEVLNDCANAPARLTGSLEKPDALLMDTETYQHLTSDIIQIGTTALNRTVLEHFLATNPYIKEIGVVNEMSPDYLESIGKPRKRFIQAYKRDPKKVAAKIYQPLKWTDTRPVGVDAFWRGAKFKFGFIDLKRPFSMHVVVLPE